jgi:GDP-4-dehydro-6-deoxy-D-mannose reductase
MRILVTGADGFVGKHLTAHLRAHGDDVFELWGHSEAREDVTHVAVADIVDGAAVSRVVGEWRPQGIIHLAGFSSVAQSHADPGRAFQVNTVGTVNLLEATRKAVPEARFLLVSSGEVYGAIPPGERAAEGHPLAPLSPYASSKVAAEIACQQFFRAHRLQAVIARPFNHIGAGQNPNFVVPSFARQLEHLRRDPTGSAIRVGNLEPIRDFSHVKDVVEAYRILLQQGVPGEAYNVGSGAGRSILSLFEELRELSGVMVEATVDPARFRPAEIASLVGDPGKLTALGWTPRHTVRDALRDVLTEARTSLVAG